jgi:hypothetical protein
MKALVVHEPGGPFVMEEHSDPVAGTGEAALAIHERLEKGDVLGRAAWMSA